MNRRALRAALPATAAVMTGYFCLGFAYGLLMSAKGFGVIWTFLMSAVVFGGSIQYLGVTLLASAFEPLSALLLSVMVNARHVFYGLSMLEPYRGTGKLRPALVALLTDETFSIVSAMEVPAGGGKAGLLSGRLCAGLQLLGGGLRGGPPFREPCYVQHHRHGLCPDCPVRRFVHGAVEESG